MSKIKLLTCPFCGREATTSEKEGIKNMPHGWGWVGCRCCRVFMNYSHGYRGKRLAIEAWNTRKPMERIIEQLEDAQDEYYRKYHDEHVDIMYNEGKSDGMQVAINIVKGGADDA